MSMNLEPSGEAIAADRTALGLIGVLLAAATVMVSVTAAIAVSDYRGDLVVPISAAANASPVVR